MNNSAIGVFDSGIGGLTCVKELVKLLPNENIIYLGDTARVPYGTRSKEIIIEYSKQDIAFLEKYNVKMVLIACGTVSSVLVSNPLFEGTSISAYSGVIMPAVHTACAVTKNKKIGVIGTPATIKSGAYGKAIHSVNADIRVVGKSCPMFVPLVENGYTGRDCEVTKMIAREYLSVMKQEEVDTLIMGCTHYPMLKDIIGDIMGDKVNLISPGEEAAKYAKTVLAYNDQLSDRQEPGHLELYCTDSVSMFSENVEAFLGKNINGEIYKCNLTV
ncbi:MAG: glutamate racemase [Ruminococcus sp.]|nr:glutamate racemase [Ruminococcus sp.]